MRLDTIDWASARADLDEVGAGLLGRVVQPDECAGEFVVVEQTTACALHGAGRTRRYATG